MVWFVGKKVVKEMIWQYVIIIIKNIDTNYLNIIWYNMIPEKKIILKYGLISSNEVFYS